MADPITAPKTRIETAFAFAVVLWRALIGLLPYLKTNAKAFIEWAADEKPGAERKPLLTAARWEEIKDVALGLPVLLLQLCIVGGCVVNLCRSQVSGTVTADPLDGAALVSADLPQIDGWYYLAALMLVLTLGRGLVREVAKMLVALKAVHASNIGKTALQDARSATRIYNLARAAERDDKSQKDGEDPVGAQ